MKERVIISIDLKSFFASVECVERGYDPFKVPLVVCDTSRGQGGMCLAVSPYLRNLGVNSRCRLFELPRNINIIKAKPRMKLYETYSNKVMNIYKTFVASEDIHIYSIDEAFLDVTSYLNYYKMSAYDLALKIMNTVKEKTHLTTTTGIGPNIFLAKVAMDIEAKHNKDCIAVWSYEDVEKKLWNITPISKIWGFGRRTEKHLNDLHIYKIKDINNYSRSFYIKRFGNVMGNDIWCKANGIDFTTIKDLNNKSKDKSMSMSQILYRNYNYDEALLIIKEMNDLLNERLINMNLTTRIVFLSIRYSRDFYKKFSDSITPNIDEDNKEKIFEVLKYLYYKNIEDLPIRQVCIGYGRLSTKKCTQLSLFDNNIIENNNFNTLINNLNDKLGRTSILRASSLLKNSTIKNRERFKNII